MHVTKSDPWHISFRDIWRYLCPTPHASPTPHWAVLLPSLWPQWRLRRKNFHRWCLSTIRLSGSLRHGWDPRLLSLRKPAGSRGCPTEDVTLPIPSQGQEGAGHPKWQQDMWRPSGKAKMPSGKSDLMWLHLTCPTLPWSQPPPSLLAGRCSLGSLSRDVFFQTMLIRNAKDWTCGLWHAKHPLYCWAMALPLGNQTFDLA